MFMMLPAGGGSPLPPPAPPPVPLVFFLLLGLPAHSMDKVLKMHSERVIYIPGRCCAGRVVFLVLTVPPGCRRARRMRRLHRGRRGGGRSLVFQPVCRRASRVPAACSAVDALNRLFMDKKREKLRKRLKYDGKCELSEIIFFGNGEHRRIVHRVVREYSAISSN